MKYKTFEKTIKELISIRKDEDNLNKALRKFCPDFNYLSLSCRCEEIIIKLLEDSFNDNDIISWWIYEMDFGKDADKKSLFVDGKIMPIKTIRDLYNYLSLGE